MNVARGNGSGRSGSFKNTVDYVMHDKDAQTQDRVGTVEMHNLAGHEPERAWREMRTTCEAASAVKTRNGIKATGQKNENPVLHYAISWHPDDKPDAAHMMEKARETIKLLGLSQHQALIVQHTDRPHKHMHLVINTVHPETGRTASLAHIGLKLDRWAHEYEVGRNAIRSFNRAAKFERAMKRVDPKPDAKPDPKKQELKRNAVKLKERIEKKRDALEVKHKAADKAREADKKSAFEDYKNERGKIFKTHRIDRLPSQPSPALEIKQRDRHKLREWMELARAMVQSGMFQKRHPLRKEFDRSLSKMAEPIKEPKVDLSRKFRLIDERKDVMLPMKHTKSAKQYAQPHIDARSRPHQQKAERQAALIRVEADYENKLFDLDKKHGQQAGREKLENLNFKKEVHRAWADFKEQHQVKERKNEWEEKRDAHKEAFNKAADDRTQVKTELTDKLWQRGTIGEFTYHAKILAEPSKYGIDAGRIIKFELHDAQGRQVLSYDHGWDVEPDASKPEHGAVAAITQHYEQVREMPTVEVSAIEPHETREYEHERSEPEIEMEY